MNATDTYILRIFVNDDQAGSADRLAETVRARATAADLPDVSLRPDARGPVIEIVGDEASLRRFWTAARDLSHMGLMVLQAA